jgi:predicted permease
MKDLFLRLRALLFRNRVEQELDDELAFHIEMETRKHLFAGMPPDEAARTARLHFGASPSVVKDYARDARGIGLLETVVYDIRYALRGFRRAPLFALTVIGTIAIGLGWNTAAFTLFNAAFLRPIDARDPYSLYSIGWQDRTGNGAPVSRRQIDELRQQRPGLAGITAMYQLRTRMDGRFASATLVDGEFFQMLGVNAALGRTLLPDDNRPQDSSPVLVLSYTAWQNRFSGAADILGRKVLIHGHPFIVVGVMPDGFTGLGHSLPDLWAPLTTLPDFEDIPNAFAPDTPAPVGLAGRLKPGQSAEQAQAALTAWMQRVAQRAVQKDAPAQAPHATLRSLATLATLARRQLAALLPVAIVFFLVLLSACANVANMMLARAMSRQREIGIRLSLGAARGRLIRQLLTESILLAVPSAALAFAVSQAFIELGLRLMVATVPAAFLDQADPWSLSPDIHVFWFMIGAAIAVALMFGLAPAIQATRLNVMQAARGDFSSDFRPTRLRNALVIAQVTVCGFLLICSGILLRRANHLERLDPGMRTRGVIEIYLQEKSRPRVIAALKSQPGVELLAASSDPPLDSVLPSFSASGAPGVNLTRVPYCYISPEYFQVLDIPLQRGRNFSADEAQSGAAVVILSESAARKLWPGQNPLDQSLNLVPETGSVRGGRPPQYRTAQVIGVVRDAAVGGLDSPDRSAVYLPTGLEDSRNALYVRVHDDAGRAVRDLSAAAEAAYPGAIEDIHSLQDFLDSAIWSYRLTYWISAALGCIALLLTISGIYGVLSYVVAQRTKEIGIRIALGAGTRTVTSLVLAQCLRLAAIGIAIGSTLALAAARIITAISPEVSVTVFDRVAYLGAMAVVFAACLAAAFFPARRAARVDPITTLRYD